MPVNTNLQQLAYAQQVQERKAELVALAIGLRQATIIYENQGSEDKVLATAYREVDDSLRKHQSATGNSFNLNQPSGVALLEGIKELAIAKVQAIQFARCLIEAGVGSTVAETVTAQLETKSGFPK